MLAEWGVVVVPGLAQFMVLLIHCTGLPKGGAFANVGATHPLLQGHWVHSEIVGYLGARKSRLTTEGDVDNAVTGLLQVRLGLGIVLPSRQVRTSQIRCQLTVQQSRTSEYRHIGVTRTRGASCHTFGGRSRVLDPGH